MSSFHPLGSAADSHPLTVPVELPFHNDEDDDAWTPPALPGETRSVAISRTRPGRTNGGGSRRSTFSIDPLNDGGDAGGGGGHAGGEGAGAEEETYSRAVNSSSSVNNGGSARRNFDAAAGGRTVWETGLGARARAGAGAAAETRAGTSGVSEQTVAQGGEFRTLSSVHSLRLHSYYTPTFCDACSQLLIGIMQQGLQCDVCRMNLHPECRSIPCSHDHRCRPPEPVQVPPGVDGSRMMGVRLKPGYPGGNNAAAGGIGGAEAAPVEDPLNSDWHRQLVQNKQLWVPDSVAAGCMVCSRPFNLVLRRHHCRRCGTCMCGWCSHTAVTDKVLSVNQSTGAVVRLSSKEPVRCCTPCTRVLDQQLARALQQKGWGANHGNQAAVNAVRQRFPGPSSTGTPFVAAGGGGYAATLPVLSSADTPEGVDGGGFMPPPAAASSGDISPARRGSAGAERAGRSSYPQGGNGGGDYGGGSGSGADDPLSREGQQQQPPASLTRCLEESGPAAGEVPSWLGRSTLGSSRRSTARPVGAAPVAGQQQQQQRQREQQQQQQQHRQEYGQHQGYQDRGKHQEHQQYQQHEGYEKQQDVLADAGEVWESLSGGAPEEATDWSKSGSVV